MAHFFVVVGGSKIHERMAHFFIDIYSLSIYRSNVVCFSFKFIENTTSHSILPNEIIALTCGLVNLLASIYVYTIKAIPGGSESPAHGCVRGLKNVGIMPQANL